MCIYARSESNHRIIQNASMADVWSAVKAQHVCRCPIPDYLPRIVPPPGGPIGAEPALLPLRTFTPQEACPQPWLQLLIYTVSNKS